MKQKKQSGEEKQSRQPRQGEKKGTCRHMELGKLAGSMTTGVILSRIQKKEKDVSDETAWERVQVLVPKAVAGGSVAPEELTEVEIKKGSAASRMTRAGDLVLKMATPFNCALITEKEEGLVVPSYCLLCRDVDESLVDLYYLAGFLNTGYAREGFQAGVAATTNTMLKPKDVSCMEIPLLPMEEQKLLGELYRVSMKKQQILKKMLKNEEQMAEALLLSAVKEAVESKSRGEVQ